MSKGFTEYFRKGDPYILATSLGLILSIGMVVLLISIILVEGLSIFWPRDLVQYKLNNGKVYLGELWSTESAKTQKNDELETIERTQVKIGNRDIYGFDFVWFNNNDISEVSYPQFATQFERWEYGNLYGYIKSFHDESEVTESGGEEIYEKSLKGLAKVNELKDERKRLQEEITELLSPLNTIRREKSILEIKYDLSSADESELDRLKKDEILVEKEITDENTRLTGKIREINERLDNTFVVVRTAEGEEIKQHLEDVYYHFQPNNLSTLAKLGHYFTKIYEFIATNPRESNTEGGVFPAIFGTVMMVILMSILVVPFGVMAAIYLNEYAKQGPLTRIIRLSVNNLAGVPSIVYGIFGLGFFVYIVGGNIDQLFFSDNLPEPTFGTGGILWASLTLALLTLPVVVVATEEGILAVPRANKEGALALGSTKWQMIKKIVLPNAMPGILTGLILAISRGAGEVAPLMITGVVKLAPNLPFDGTFPFFHLDRKFMHLGFHIYDVGFQSPNVEAAIPMVYSTALLLIVIVVLLNILAIYLRNKLRKKYKSSSF